MHRTVLGIGTAALLWAAAGAAADVDVVPGGVVVPVGAGSGQIVLKLTNKTPKHATDITVSLEGNQNVKITELDLTTSNRDNVDDNGNGKLDAGENDTKASPASKTVKTIFKGMSIPPGAYGHEITVKFDGQTQEGAQLRIKFSRTIGDTHYDMLANVDTAQNPNGQFMVSSGAAQIAPGFVCSDPQMGIGVIELFGNPQNPITNVQLPVGYFGDVQFDGPNVVILPQPPLPADVINGIGLELQFPVDEFNQFPMFYNTELFPFPPQDFCVADWNNDGLINILDFVAFQNAYIAQDPEADLNNDGVHNILDFIEFQNKWQEGCVQKVFLNADFEDFDLGSSCQNGWSSWDDNGACGLITDQNSRTGTQCLLIDVEGNNGQGDDVVYLEPGELEYSWLVQIWTYLPSDSTGKSYVSLFNTYEVNGPKDWSGIIEINADSGLILDDPLNQQNPPSLPLIVDQWVPIDVHVDLENDTADYFYGGQPLVLGKSWSAGVGGVGEMAFKAINFYAGEPGEGGITGLYIDDVKIVTQD